MRLFRGKVEVIAEDVIKSLRASNDIEVENEAEAKLDIEAVLKEYLRLDREIVEEAKNRMEARGLGYSNLGRVKSQVAKIFYEKWRKAAEDEGYLELKEKHRRRYRQGRSEGQGSP